MNIVFVGISGSGKSTVGRFLARRRGVKFVDTDRLVERREGRKIHEIFKTKGEKYFRKVEKEIVIRALEKANVVVSLGGGAVEDRDVRNMLKKKTRYG